MESHLQLLTARFTAPAALEAPTPPRAASPGIVPMQDLPSAGTGTADRVFLAKLDGAPPALRHALAQRGWVECDDDDDGGGGGGNNMWHLFWKNARFTAADYKRGATAPHTRINHIPKSMAITKKDLLHRNLRKFKSVYGALYNFFPDGFLLPSEYTKFVKHYTKQEPGTVWICKPIDLSRGRKIFLFRDIGDLTVDQMSLVQSYIARPLCIGGYKMDLRLYGVCLCVCVSMCLCVLACGCAVAVK